MLKPLSLLRLMLMLISLGLAVQAGAQGVLDYRIGAGDVLSVTVFGEDDLSLPRARVGTNGKISFPLLGEVSVKGLTAGQVEARLIELLADGYLRKPIVTVSIITYRQFYVRGQVKAPGGYNFQEGLTVEKAVTLAGGFTERASIRKITLIREANPQTPLNSVTLGEDVYPGDIISVGESFF